MARGVACCALLAALSSVSCVFSVESLDPVDDLSVLPGPDLTGTPPEDLTGAPPQDLSGVTVADLSTNTPPDMTIIPMPPDMVGTTPLLSGTRVNIPGSTNLTAEGTTDWTHYGRQNSNDVNRKAGTAPQILMSSNVAVKRFGSYSRNFSWSDGVTGGNLVASEASTTGGTYLDNTGDAYTITAPAGTGTRTLRLYTLCFRGSCALSAHLSDSSAADYNDTVTNDTGGTYSMYTLTYRAGSSPRNLTVTWTYTNDTNGSLDLLAATLF
jgi:hypothetical protein